MFIDSVCLVHKDVVHKSQVGSQGRNPGEKQWTQDQTKTLSLSGCALPAVIKHDCKKNPVKLGKGRYCSIQRQE